MVIAATFYLYRVTLKFKVIALFMAVEPLRDLNFKVHGVASRHLFIDFRPS